MLTIEEPFSVEGFDHWFSFIHPKENIHCFYPQSYKKGKDIWVVVYTDFDIMLVKWKEGAYGLTGKIAGILSKPIPI